jgi:predicted nucleic acid-binding protein
LIVVSNTSPIIALEYLGQLQLLTQFWDSVVIPGAVRDELRPRVLPPYIKVRELSVIPVEADTEGLDIGEAEAIALAIACQADLILLDDRAARRRAIELGLPMIGTLAILRRGKLEGLIPQLRPLLEQLSHLRFHMSPSLFERILREAGE